MDLHRGRMKAPALSSLPQVLALTSERSSALRFDSDSLLLRFPERGAHQTITGGVAGLFRIRSAAALHNPDQPVSASSGSSNCTELIFSIQRSNLRSPRAALSVARQAGEDLKPSDQARCQYISPQDYRHSATAEEAEWLGNA